MPKRFHYVPDSWELPSSLRGWAASKGLTDDQIDKELVKFRLYEWDKPKMDFNRCWQTRILNGLERGWIEKPHSYHRPEEISPEQRREDAEKAEADFRRLRAVK